MRINVNHVCASEHAPGVHKIIDHGVECADGGGLEHLAVALEHGALAEVLGTHLARTICRHDMSMRRMWMQQSVVVVVAAGITLSLSLGFRLFGAMHMHLCLPVQVLMLRRLTSSHPSASAS